MGVCTKNTPTIKWLSVCIQLYSITSLWRMYTTKMMAEKVSKFNWFIGTIFGKFISTEGINKVYNLKKKEVTSFAGWKLHSNTALFQMLPMVIKISQNCQRDGMSCMRECLNYEIYFSTPFITAEENPFKLWAAKVWYDGWDYFKTV